MTPDGFCLELVKRQQAFLQDLSNPKLRYNHSCEGQGDGLWPEGHLGRLVIRPGDKCRDAGPLLTPRDLEEGRPLCTVVPTQEAEKLDETTCEFPSIL